MLLWFHLPDGKHSEEIPLLPGFKQFEQSEDVVLAEDFVKVIMLNIAHCHNKLRR